MIRLGQAAVIPAHYMNRHVLVTGPTGTGKTVSIINLIENLSKLNVPVIAPDVKECLKNLPVTG